MVFYAIYILCGKNLARFRYELKRGITTHLSYRKAAILTGRRLL